MSKIFHYVCQIIIIDHLHARTKEFINALIVVTSQLDAVVASLSVLQPVRFLLIYTLQLSLRRIHATYCNYSIDY